MKSLVLTDNPFGEDYAKRAGVAPWRGALPGPRVEEWKFTPLRDVTKIPFIPASAVDDVDVTEIPFAVPVIPGARRVVLVNGVYRADLSDKAAEAKSLRKSPQAAKLVDLPMAALNAAYAQDGVVVRTAKDTKADTIHIISIGASGAEPVAFHPRLIIDIAPGSSATVVESHVGLPGQSYLANPVAEITVGANATLRRYVHVAEDSEAFHLAAAVVNLSASATYEGFQLGMSGHTVRQEVHIAFTAEGASATLNGAYALSGRTHHDFTTFMDHRVPHCNSAQVFKGVLDGSSHGVYQGRILVARDAQKTDARQLHKAMFLNRGPQVDVKPELEIFADDVQCAHGAATGEIDHDHMFYLMSRGIDPDAARGLLVEGFLAESLIGITDDAVRDAFGGLIDVWLKRRAAGAP